MFRRVYLCITEDPEGFKIQSGNLTESRAFSATSTLLVSDKKPNVIWDLLHDLMGIPYPRLEPIVIEPVKPDPVPEPAPVKPQKIRKDLSLMEEELKKLSAKQIIEKVQKEKGILITNCLKSKSAIIKKALKVYSTAENTAA